MLFQHLRKGEKPLPPLRVLEKEADALRVIVGLGNPGRKYLHTRHNVGFDVLEVISQKTGVAAWRDRCKASVAEGLYKGEKIALARPQTFMNLSGVSVAALLRWYKIEPGHLLVVFDDIDLPLGKLRLRAEGGAGTHNGMRSIVEELGRQDFPRLRVGIGPKPEPYELADFVLSHYADAAERATQFDAFLRAADVALTWVGQGFDEARKVANATVGAIIDRPKN